jgi:O-antigen/teichoic acid export membrane protein
VRLVRKGGWNVVDQGLSAASNVALAIAVANFVSAAEFGAFAIAFMVYGIAVAATKSLVGQPLQMRYSSASPDDQRARIQQAIGSALALAALGSVVTALVGGFVPGTVGDSLLALAVVLPALLAQDSCRMAMFTLGKPAAAAAIDAIWTVLQFVLIALAIVTGHQRQVWLLILLWGVGAGLSALVGLALLKVWPDLRGGLAWLRAERHLTRYLFPEYLMGLGAAQLGLVLVGVLATAEDVGFLRAAQVLLGPLGIVSVAALQFAVPEMSARPDLTSRQRAVVAAGVSAALGLISVVYLALLLLIPERVGAALFGESWTGAALVLLPMGLAALASGQSYGPMAALYALGRAQWTFRISLLRGPLTLAAVLIAAVFWAAPGAAWALFAAEAVVLPAWLFTLRKALRVGTVVTHDTGQPQAAT